MTDPVTEIAQDSFLGIILSGGGLSIAVLVILLIMSILSWTVIGWKSVIFNVAARKASSFLKNLDLTEGLEDAKFRSQTFDSAYYAREFQAANDEFDETIRQLKNSNYVGDKNDFLQRIERSIEKCIVKENIRFDKALIALATISSSAPFIGLLGTVVGIIDAFYSIGSQGTASIAVVAPGISAALVATACGLFAAIPALMAYNVFRNKTRIIRQEMESFGFDLINLFDREFSKTIAAARRSAKKNSSTGSTTDVKKAKDRSGFN